MAHLPTPADGILFFGATNFKPRFFGDPRPPCATGLMWSDGFQGSAQKLTLGVRIFPGRRVEHPPVRMVFQCRQNPYWPMILLVFVGEIPDLSSSCSHLALKVGEIPPKTTQFFIIFPMKLTIFWYCEFPKSLGRPLVFGAQVSPGALAKACILARDTAAN